METKNITLCHPERSRRIPWTSRKFTGFTLVELIVVITILVILGTIAFLNLGNFSSGARDGARVSDMANISKGLDISFVKTGYLPVPDASVVTIAASGTTIGYQGYAGANVLGIARMSTNVQDPTDKKYYTYLVNADKSKYQLLALMEEAGNVVGSVSGEGWENGMFASPVYAGYETRYPATKGSSLGVLLGSTGATINQPLQEITSGTFELTTATGSNYQAYVSKTSTIVGSGSALGGLAGTYTVKTASSVYPGCDTKDIALPNGQVWAACNVGATHAYAGEIIIPCSGVFTDCSSSYRYFYGSYFQWGRNDDVTRSATWAALAATGTLSNNVGHSTFIVGDAIRGDWISASNDNLWGWSGTTSTGGTYLSQWSPTAMQWPCASGYHVPTQYEWWTAISSINPGVVNTSAYQIDTNIASTLKIPLAGRRYSDGKYLNLWLHGFYYVSTPATTPTISGMTYAFSSVHLTVTGIYPIEIGTSGRSVAYSIRCIKN